MSAETIKILELLQQGKITVEEAENLLKKVTQNEGSEMLHTISGSIASSVQALGEYVSAQDFDFPWPNTISPTETKTFQSDALLQDICAVNLTGKNDKITIQAYDGDCIEIEARYRPKKNANPRIDFKQNDNGIRFDFDAHAIYAMGLQVKVPKKRIEQLKAETTNASISANGVVFTQAHLTTKNASIHMDNARGDTLRAVTKNASITVSSSDMNQADLKTSNAKIALDAVHSTSCTLQTSNAAIKLEGCDIKSLGAATINGKIQLDDIQMTEGAYSIEAKTTNGSIQTDFGINRRDIPLKIDASTSITGSIQFKGQNFNAQKRTKDCIKGQSFGYGQSSFHANLQLKTTNGSIKIR